MMTTTFRSGPPAEQLPIENLTGETPPKRGPGRPRKTSSTRTSSGQFGRRDLKSEVSGFLFTMNMALAMIPPLRVDVLDVVEIDALSTAIVEEAKRSARFAKMVDSMLKVTGGAGLFGIVFIIGARRAARHGILPPETDMQLGMLLSMSLDKSSIVPPPPVNPNADASG